YMFTPFNDKLYYRGWDSTHGYEVWSTDGTPANTVRVTDLSPQPAPADDINELEVMDGRLYIGADSGLYRTDGTAADTTRIPTATGEPLVAIGRYPITTNGLVRVGHRMYFTAIGEYRRGAGEEVWRTSDDGATLIPLGDISPGPEGSSPFDLTAAGDT